MSPALKTKDSLRHAPLCEALGVTAQAIILQFLQMNRDIDYTLNEIEKGTGIRRHTISRALPSLMRFNLVIINREIGQAPLYKYNVDSKVAKLYNPFYEYLLETMTVEKTEEGAEEKLSGITID